MKTKREISGPVSRRATWWGPKCVQISQISLCKSSSKRAPRFDEREAAMSGKLRFGVEISTPPRFTGASTSVGKRRKLNYRSFYRLFTVLIQRKDAECTASTRTPKGVLCPSSGSECAESFPLLMMRLIEVEGQDNSGRARACPSTSLRRIIGLLLLHFL